MARGEGAPGWPGALAPRRARPRVGGECWHRRRRGRPRLEGGEGTGARRRRREVADPRAVSGDDEGEVNPGARARVGVRAPHGLGAAADVVLNGGQLAPTRDLGGPPRGLGGHGGPSIAEPPHQQPGVVVDRQRLEASTIPLMSGAGGVGGEPEASRRRHQAQQGVHVVLGDGLERTRADRLTVAGKLELAVFQGDREGVGVAQERLRGVLKDGSRDALGVRTRSLATRRRPRGRAARESEDEDRRREKS